MSKSAQKTTTIKAGKNLTPPSSGAYSLIASQSHTEISLPSEVSEERINIRLAAAHKSTIELAAGLKGLSLTDYVRSTMLEQARADIQHIKEVTLTEQDVQMILDSAQSKSQPSARLHEASERYLKMVSGQS